MMGLIERVAQAIGNEANIGVAVSGGADSVFLLTALHQLGRATAVLHINHALRGADSDADESFVRELAQALALPFHSVRLPPEEGNLEQEARNLRYSFFINRIAVGQCKTVATGHTLDDQAETVLYRFLRGSGTAGLSGIHPQTESGIIRPLLELRRAEIREYLTARNIPWREDLSNHDLNFRRNQIRAKAIPALTDLNPALPEVLASTAAWAQAEEDYWRTEIARLALRYLKVAPETAILEIEPFVQFPLAVRRRLLRHAIVHVKGDLRTIGFHHIEAILALMTTREGSGRIQLPGLDVYRSFDLLRLAPQHFDARMDRDFSAPLVIPGDTCLPERQLLIRTELAIPARVYNSDGNALDRAKCRLPLQVRNWRPGDQFERSGHAGAVKIKTLFQDYRIPLWERRRWPVVISGDAIAWTRRFGAARDVAASAESKSVLVITDLQNGESNPASGTSY